MSMITVTDDLRDFLDAEASRINSKSFIADDPVQFPRRFDNLRDIEIVSLLSAMIAWGRRTMICRDCERLLEMMDGQPTSFCLDGEYERVNPEKNIHRTFFGRDLIYFMRGMRRIYSRWSSLDAFAAEHGVGKTDFPSWELVAAMQREMCEANERKTCSQCLPVNLDATALKRINMALRWLVRDDGIVDLGAWNSIDKSKLFIPLDVHVGNIARELGMLTRRSNDRKAVELLTGVLRTMRPDDPVVYDYALFGIGAERALKSAQ